MKKADLINKTMDFITANSNTMELVVRAVQSGAIDVAAIPDGDYTEIRAIAAAVMTEIGFNMKPTTKSGIESMTNVQIFL